MIAELVEDRVHLERRENRLDQDGALDRPVRQPELALGDRERARPQTRLEMRLELREVEVRPRSPCELLLCVVEDDETEIEQRGADRGAVDLMVTLDEVPAPRPDHQGRGLLVQAVALPARVELDRAPHGVMHVLLAAATLSHVGEFASSKSAMKTRAPELSALIIIFRSTGPVISTRRSCRSAGAGVTVKSSGAGQNQAAAPCVLAGARAAARARDSARGADDRRRRARAPSASTRAHATRSSGTRPRLRRPASRRPRARPLPPSSPVRRRRTRPRRRSRTTHEGASRRGPAPGSAHGSGRS